MPDKRLTKGLEGAKYTGKDEPPTAGDMALSNKHLKERITFNEKHRDDHDDQVERARAILKKRGVR